MFSAPLFCLCTKFILIHNLAMYLLFLVLRNVTTNSGQSKTEHTPIKKKKKRLIYHNLPLLLMENSTSTNIHDTKQVSRFIKECCKINFNLIKICMPSSCQPCQWELNIYYYATLVLPSDKKEQWTKKSNFFSFSHQSITSHK